MAAMPANDPTVSDASAPSDSLPLPSDPPCVPLDPPAVPSAPPSLWRNIEYRRWLTGDLALSLGAGIGAFAFPLITLAATGSLAATGMVGMAQGIGGLVGMIPGGLLADRHDRRRLRMLAGATGAGIQAILIAVLLAGWGSLPALAALAFTDRLRGALFGGASHAMLKQIVPPAQLPRAFAVNEGREAAVDLGSGPLGGLLLGVSIACPPLAQLLGNLGSLLATWTMRGDYRPRAADAAPTRVRDDLREAAAWAFRQKIRVQLLWVAIAVNLGSNGLMLTVVLNLASHGVSAERIGLLTTVIAAAILAGAIAAPRLVDTVPTGALIIAPILLIALAGASIPFAPNLLWVGAAYAAMGIGIPALNAASQGFFMHITPPDAGTDRCADEPRLDGADAARPRARRMGARARWAAAHPRRVRRYHARRSGCGAVRTRPAAGPRCLGLGRVCAGDRAHRRGEGRREGRRGAEARHGGIRRGCAVRVAAEPQ